MIRRIAALVLAAGLGAGASACTSWQSGTAHGPARYASLDALASPAAPRAGTPVAVMPAWIGKPIRVRERADAEGFEQAVSLALSARGDAPGNLVLVTTRRPSTSSLDATTGEPRPMSAPSEAGIRAEIEAAFPGIAMTVVARPSANAYGPYGLAVGRSPRGARCLYAWQWIDDMRATGGAGWPASPLSLRVRLCRDDITLEAMAAAVTKLRLVPPSQAAPVPDTAVAAAPAQPGETRRGRGRSAEAEPAPREQAAPYPAHYAAAPTLGMQGRRYLGAEAPAEPAASPVALATSARMPGYGASRPATTPTALAADLPAEAFRGPGGR